MYRNPLSHISINWTFSDDFQIQVGLHQGSVSPQLFIMVLEALLREVRSGCQEQLLYPDDLALEREGGSIRIKSVQSKCSEDENDD